MSHECDINVSHSQQHWEHSFFFTDLPIAAHHHLFSSKHDVSGSLQPDRRVQHSYSVALYCTSGFTCLYSKHDSLPVQYGLLAAVKVFKFLLGHRVVNVHGWDTQLACL